jgi:hypothetical protein
MAVDIAKYANFIKAVFLKTVQWQDDSRANISFVSLVAISNETLELGMWSMVSG